MVYLFESKLPDNQSINFALVKIYGIGKSTSYLICKKLGFSLNLKVKNLLKDQIIEILKVIELLKLMLSQDLKKFKLLVFKNLVSMQSYKGRRRNLGFPVRGQRTHTNAKTSRKKFL
jgi:small subunit ribosomal protein S13